MKSIVFVRTESGAIVQSIPNSDSKGRTPFHADRHGNSDNPRLHQTWSIIFMGNIVCNVPLHPGANTCEITARGLNRFLKRVGGEWNLPQQGIQVEVNIYSEIDCNT